MKILNTIGPQFNQEAKNILEKLGEVTYLKLTQNELKNEIGKYGAVVIGLGLRFDKDMIDSAPNLKFIATATTGLDHIDIRYAEEKDIKVLALQDEDLREITGTAELAFGLMIALVRNIPVAFADVKMGNWEREKFLGTNLVGKTLGILGLGRLGSKMAKYGQVFGMNIVACDINKTEAEIGKLVNFDELIILSDIISIHIPLNDNTACTFKKEVFEKMKNSALLINTSRGRIVNEADLLVALESKTIAGYAADVLSGEVEFGKDATRSQLVQYAKTHDNIIITPHIGGYTAESRAATDIIIAKKILDLSKKSF